MNALLGIWGYYDIHYGRKLTLGGSSPPAESTTQMQNGEFFRFPALKETWRFTAGIRR